MGIPRFYRWLKGRYPLIRLDLSDKNKEIPIFDHFYIDFNALVYQCIRESNCFLRNKIKPLTFQQIYERVFYYLQELISVVNPQQMIFIAFDGVAPRAKINQSRDRRFKSSSQQQLFDKILQQIGVEDGEYFQQNSISPGTKFLYDLCVNLKKRIIKEIEQDWKHLKIFFSDCCVPGEGEHKIMDFLRYTKKYNTFNKKTTMCVYSPDADVILLTLSLGIQNICLIKQDTNGPVPQGWTATTVYRKSQPKQFELVMINLLREYFEKQFADILKQVDGSTIQQILDDLILLMAFVGNDFLPLQFCFTLKDNHIQNLFVSYKTYLKEHKQFINNRGKIDWQNIYKLLQIGKKFEAKMIEEMILKKKGRRPKNMVEMNINHNNKPNGQNGNGENIEQVDILEDIENFEVQNETVTKGRDKYYQTRFGIEDIKTDPKYEAIIKSYIEGLEFYCEYYFIGLPSWSWFYPYHYTPMLTDVYEYLRKHKVNITFPPSEPFDPFLALMFMVSLRSTVLLPKLIEHNLRDPKNLLRNPVDYFPTQFELDKFQTLKYNKRALIQFLNQSDVRKVYESIPQTSYSQQQLKRNQRNNFLLLQFNFSTRKTTEQELKLNRSANMTENELKLQEIVQQKLTQVFNLNNKAKQLVTRDRFPTLKIWGNNFQLNDGKIVTKNKYKYNGNPGEIVFFNNFLGVIEDADNSNQQLKTLIELEYARNGIVGKCDFIYTIKRVSFVRQINRFCLKPSRREVLVPDFAVFKPPNYDYIRKTETFQSSKLYEKGQIVSILTAKYFGFQGIIQKLDEKTAQINLLKAPVSCSQKTEQLQDQFYTVDYVLDHLNIKYETLIAIMDELVILPQFNRKKEPVLESTPSAVNFSLNIIDINQRLIVPRFVRCQIQYQNTKRPQEIFKKMEISKAALKNLQKYCETYDWLIDYIQEAVQNKSFVFRRPIYARQIFSEFEKPNMHMYREFIKLYDFDNEGCFYSIYSKVSEKIPQFTYQAFQPASITFRFNEIISRKQARIAPPALKYQPQYHNIGDKVIILRNLLTGYVVGIDDFSIHVKAGKDQIHFKLRFHDAFNEHWSGFLAVEEGKSWNLECSYFSPNYWKKAIDLEKNEQDIQNSDFD